MPLIISLFSGQFMLTELGHGLDIANMETKATRLPSGEFLLHSPTPSAAKSVLFIAAFRCIF